MKSKYLLSTFLILPFTLWAAGSKPIPTATSALAFQQQTSTRIMVEENHLRFFTGGSERMTIDVNGNVGIGTNLPTKNLHLTSTAPSVLLERVGSVSWETRIDNNGRFIIQDATNSTEPVKIESAAPTGTIYVKSNGNLGVGTNNPKTLLEVGSAAGYGTASSKFGVNGNKVTGFTSFGNLYDTNDYDIASFGRREAGHEVSAIKLLTMHSSNSTQGARIAFLNSDVPGITSGTLKFMVGGGTGVDVMNLLSNGNVGIGTAVPDTGIEIRKDVNNSAINLFYDNQGAKISNHDSNIGSYSSLKLETRGDPDGAYIRAINRGNNNVDFSIGKYMSASGGVSIDFLNILSNGNVGIATTSPSYKLHVGGTVRATKFISSTQTYADFVFEDDYKLPTLNEVETFIEENNHLPDIPSEAEARANGIDLQEMQAKLLQKIEELTLYVIEQNKKIEEQNKRIKQLEK